jgi:hypothetical protein
MKLGGDVTLPDPVGIERHTGELKIELGTGGLKPYMD